MKILQSIQETEIVLRGAPAIFLTLFIVSVFALAVWTGFCWLMDKIS